MRPLHHKGTWHGWQIQQGGEKGFSKLRRPRTLGPLRKTQNPDIITPKLVLCVVSFLLKSLNLYLEGMQFPGISTSRFLQLRYAALSLREPGPKFVHVMADQADIHDEVVNLDHDGVIAVFNGCRSSG